MLLANTALDHYFHEHVVKKVVARERFEYAQNALNSYFTGIPLQKIDIPMSRDYREHRSVVKDATVRRELGVLQAASNHALKWRRIRADEMPSIELPEEGPPKTIWLTKEELKLLAAAAKETSERIERFVVLAYYTAARRHSIETLEWERIDLQANRINLARKNEIITKKRRPIVPVPEEVLDRLKEWKSRSDSPYVLENPSSVYYEFGVASKKAGLENLPAHGMRQAGALTPHALRHSRATHLLQDGKSPWAVANLLGDSLPTVLRVYGHACPDYMEGVLT